MLRPPHRASLTVDGLTVDYVAHVHPRWDGWCIVEIHCAGGTIPPQEIETPDPTDALVEAVAARIGHESHFRAPTRPGSPDWADGYGRCPAAPAYRRRTTTAHEQIVAALPRWTWEGWAVRLWGRTVEGEVFESEVFAESRALEVAPAPTAPRPQGFRRGLPA